MIRLDTPPDSVDRAYAKSLFELVEGQGGRAKLEELDGELDELVDLLRSEPKLEEFLASQIIPVDQKEKSLRSIFAGRISDPILNTMLYLVRKDRGGRFVRVAGAYDEMVQERFGRIEVDVYTRLPIPEDQLASLKERLQAEFAREPVIYPYTDETMIGGIRIRVGDKLVDASFNTRLRRMSELFKEEGMALMREKAQQAIDDSTPSQN
jgi:F-type H+-transporting ATPase subunit delta